MDRMPRRLGYKRPVNSLKHVIDVSGETLGGTVSVIPLANVVRSLDNSNIVPVEVESASTIGPMFLSVFVLGSTGSTSGLVDWYVWKVVGGNVAGGSIPDPGDTGQAELRRWIFHEEKGLAATQDGTPMVFKGVIRISPRYRRMGDGDTIQLRLLTEAGVNLQFCVKAIYKTFK